MTDFPRTMVENLSLPRMLVGTNWFLGYSHMTKAQDEMIIREQTREKLADILEVFFIAGIDAVYGCRPESPHLEAAIKDAEDRTGRRCIKIGTPTFDLADTPEARSANLKVLDGFAEIGCKIALPHQNTTDLMLDRKTRTIREMDYYVEEIRARGMLPGLSTHMPETPVLADETGLDVAVYIQPYNALGFLMQIEVDWVQRMIWDCKKPVIAIKPLAAGRTHPLVGLSFCWSTLREQDMVCIGCYTPQEAREVIEISWSIFEHRVPDYELQETRSKKSVKRADG